MNAEQIAMLEFEKVGDDKLFPNHSDKDIWIAGFVAAHELLTKTNIKTMKKVIENSSQIAEVEFNSERKVITVTFKPKGAKYEYADCTEDEYNKIINAESAGKAVNEILKGAGKQFIKLPQE